MRGLYFHIQSPSGEKQSWPLQLPTYTVGRAEGQPAQGHLQLMGDNLISRQHFKLQVGPSVVTVERLESGRNPLFFRGQESDKFGLPPGETFVVGQTRCWIGPESPSLSGGAEPTEMTLFGVEREKVRKNSSFECFQALMKMLPELRRCSDEQTIWSTALRVLRQLLPEASGLQVLREDGDVVVNEGQNARASRRLLQRAKEQGCTVSFVWDQTSSTEATVLEQVTWAVASPVDNHMLYAVGETPAQDLNPRVAMLDVVAETVAHHLTLTRVHRIEAQVGQFFSPILRKLLSDSGLEQALQPRRVGVTVLFFDLRGFSKATEAAEDDNALEEILRYHGVLTEVMTAVTECVFARDGVVIDYQGDAVLACWGTPVAREDHAELAVSAALDILRKVYALDLPFEASGKGGKQLRCGLGLGSGEAIAGQVGARGLAKFGVMGRVVNHASRLEGLTKQLGIPILINQRLHEQLPPDLLRRCVGKVRPAGVKEASYIYEVVAPREEGGSGLTAEQVKSYEDAYRHYQEGEFLECLQLLRNLPVDDPLGSYLTRQALILQDEELSSNWEGLLEFRSK